MAYGRFQASRAFKIVRQTADLTLNSASWANFPTLATVVLTGQVGDVIEVAFGARYTAGAADAYIDAVTEVAATATNSFATGTTAPTSTTGVGVGSWFCDTGVVGEIGGSAFYTLVGGDISSGAVTIRMRYRTSSATNKVLAVAGGNIFQTVRNLGPVDPH